MGFSDNFIAEVLSINNVVGSWSYSSCFQTKYRKWQSYMAYLAASAATMYSASNDDIAVIGCFLLDQLTSPLASMKIYPLVEHYFTKLP
jgi:hypothetical protein